MYIENLFKSLYVSYGRFKNTLPKYRHDNPEFQCDLWFIDGGHDIDTATSDLTNALNMISNENGYIIIDDINDINVKTAWENVLKRILTN